MDGTKRAGSPEPRWALRDWFAAAGLFLATAGVVLWQNAHVAVLFDLSYILNTAARIALGQVPYRDFPLAHAPLTFLIQAAIIRLTGRVFFHHVLYVGFDRRVGHSARVEDRARFASRARGGCVARALLVAAPLCVLGIYCIVPNPEYDCDGGFWILVALWMLQRLDAETSAKTSASLGLAAGAALCVPLFFKQNMGLPFLVVAIGAVLLLLALNWRRRWKDPAPGPSSLTLFSVLAGACVTLATAVLALHCTAGIGNYLHWTFEYAGQRRLPGFSLMLGVYSDPSLLWTLPCVAVALVLFGVTILRAASSAKDGNKTPLGAHRGLRPAGRAVSFHARLLVPLRRRRRARRQPAGALAAAAVLAAALAVANLFGLRRRTISARVPAAGSARRHPRHVHVAAALGVDVRHLAIARAAGGRDARVFLRGSRPAPPSRWFVPALAALISVTLLVCGGFYTASEERLSYAYLPDGPPAHSAFPQLAGLATPGPYLPEIDELLRYAQANIPFDNGIVLVPGEEPFYFATGRAPRFPVPFFDPTIDPYSPAEIASLVRSRNIRWLIVKRDLQTKEDPTPDREATMQALMSEFTLAARLRGYDVYRRR